MLCLGSDPVALREGKRAGHVYGLTKFFLPAQKVGHRGIREPRYIYDKAATFAATRLVRRRSDVCHKVCAETDPS